MSSQKKKEKSELICSKKDKLNLSKKASKAKMWFQRKVKSAQIKNNYVVYGWMLGSGERDMVLPWAKKRNVSMFRSDINSFNQGCC